MMRIIESKWLYVGLFVLMCLNHVLKAEETVDHQTQYAIGVHVFSVHSTPRDNVAGRAWNNANPGIYFRRDNVVVGTYYNSIRKQSVYVGYSYPVTDYLDVCIGLVSGYNGPGYRAKPISPMLIPTFHGPITSRMDWRINIAPGIGKNSATAINFALEYKL